MISYYELLGMIKEGNIPEKIEVQLPNVNYSRTYYAEYDNENFTNYFLLEVEDSDENYDVYLADCFLECEMFKKCIRILEEDDDFEDILEWGEGALEEIETKRNYKIAELQKYICILMQTQNQLTKNQKKIIEKLKEKK